MKRAKGHVSFDEEVCENGGTVETIEFVEGFSTTNIINKIAAELKNK